MAKKRLVRGLDWHAWVWCWDDDGIIDTATYPTKAKAIRQRSFLVSGGHWIRVKFVKVRERP
jgi:hypothetical protein